MTDKVCEKVIIKRALWFDSSLTVLDPLLSFPKGVEAMRSNVIRFVLVVSTAIILSGCYSGGGRWTTPNFAFWKRSPFQSTPSVAPSMVGAPMRPSRIAASNGGNTTTAPPANYASTGADTMAPPVTSKGTAVSYSTPEAVYPASEYPSTPPSSRAPAYTASTAGVPGARAYATAPADVAGVDRSYGPTGGASPYSGPNPYASQAATSYSATPSTPSYNARTDAPAAYAPTETPSADRGNPVRPIPAYPSTNPGYPESSVGNGSYGAGANRYNEPNTANRYGNPAAGSRYGAGGGSSCRTDSGPRYAETVPNVSGSSGIPATATSGDRYATPDSGTAPLVGSRYAAPSAAPPTAGSGGHTPSTSAYDPGLTNGSGYSVPDANHYAPPGGFSVPPADNSSEPPAYRPGSTGDYVPGSTSTGSLGTPYTMSGVLPSVSPASYTSPSVGVGM